MLAHHTGRPERVHAGAFVTAMQALSPIACVVSFGLAFAYLIGDGIHQNLTNPAKRHPLSKGVERRRAAGKW